MRGTGRRLHPGIGLTDLVTWAVPPGMQPDQMNPHLEMFARDVAPRLRAMFPG